MNVCTSILGTLPGERETGASVVDLEFVRNALLLGHSIQVIAPPARSQCVGQFPGVELLNGGVLSNGPLSRLRRFWRVWSEILSVHRAQPETVFRVNSFFSSLLEILPLLVMTRGCCRVLVQFHHKDHNRWRNAVARWIIERAHVVVCPSKSACTELTELLGNTPSDLRCIHHGVSEKFFVTQQAVERDVDVAPLRLLFVGHLERRKNPLFLLELAQALHGEVPFVLTIVGNGPELENLLKTSVDKSWAAAVEFASEVSDHDKLALYSRADLFVFPSIQEGFGLVLCEAMAAGVPVIAFQTSAMPEIVKPGTGFMVPINDLQAMADRVKSIAADRDLLSAMRVQAVLHARRNFQWKQKVRAIFDALHDNFDLQKKTP